MWPVFKGIDILNFAVEIEKNGQEFYLTSAEKISHPDLKALFRELGEQEGNHIGDFQQLMSTVDDYQPAETYPGEYMAYVKVLVDEHVFKKNSNIQEIVLSITSPQDALDLALRFEKDSILFFHELRRVASVYHQKIIDELIDQEYRHIQVLAEIKGQLAKK